MIDLPTETAPHNDEKHQEYVGKDTKNSKAQENTCLRLWIFSTCYIPVGSGSIWIQERAVQCRLYAWQDHCLSLQSLHFQR